MQDQHNRLCKKYKDSKTMEEAESRYLAIRAWWLSLRAAFEDSIRDLNLWLAFSISPMGWLHANGKLIIIGPLSHIKSSTVTHLDTKLYLYFSCLKN
jgi:hypothetical protein